MHQPLPPITAELSDPRVRPWRPALLWLAICALTVGSSAFTTCDLHAQPEQTSPAPEHPPNRLAKESSPYLLLHARNPVDWWPWGPEALAEAKRTNKPIFLSVGYSSCYWCHVMERLVFENAEIAELMNKYFVNVKVDREERPDIDDLYMLSLTVYYQMIGAKSGGGWPLSMFLTPDGRPIAGGTYFPPESKPGMIGFPAVCEQVHGAWLKEEERVRRTASLVAAEVTRLSVPALNLQSSSLSTALVAGTISSVSGLYDPQFGGFDFDSDQPQQPKFPEPCKLVLLQSLAGEQDAALLAKLDQTLDRMAAGGIQDHLGGGFHRYSTDREWLVPHFEKMLYDNVQLGEIYAEAYLRTSRKAYRRVAEDTLDFLLRDMRDQAGGFHSALDAETDGIEGKFYVWSPAEVDRLLPPQLARAVRAAYGIDLPTAFEHGHVLHLPRPLSDTAAALQIPLDGLEATLAQARQILVQARSRRPPLLKDDKCLAAWNGLAIGAFARAGQILRRPDYLEAATTCARFVLDQMRDGSGELLHTYRQGRATIPGYLEDYACVAAGLLTLHEATGDPQWLTAARDLTDRQISLFHEENRGGFYATSARHEQLFARGMNAYDSVTPSGNSVSVRNLVSLSRLTREDAYLELARGTLKTFAPRLEEQPGGYCWMALGLSEYLAASGGDSALAAAGPAENPPPAGPAPAPKPAPAADPAAVAEADPEPVDIQALVPFAKLADDEAKKHEHVTVLPCLSTRQLHVGDNPVAFVVVIEREWHINANPARPKQMKATQVTATFAQSSQLEQLAYPRGADFPVKGIDEPLSVYEGQAVIRGVITVPAAAAGREERIEVSIRYQCCNDESCLIPRTMKFQATVPVAPADAARQKVNPELWTE